MSLFDHVAETVWDWHGHEIRVATDGLGPYYWPNSTDQPQTWETMLFCYDGPEDVHSMQWRYLSREKAVKGHVQAVEATKRYLGRVGKSADALLRLRHLPGMPKDALERGALLILRYGIGGDIGTIPAQDIEYPPVEEAHR